MKDNILVVEIGSDNQYENLVAFIEYSGPVMQLVAIISQEEGYDNLKISLPIDIPPDKDIPYKQYPTFKLQELEEAIKKAKNGLRGTRSINSEDENRDTQST
jgi:hypothetical protein